MMLRSLFILCSLAILCGGCATKPESASNPGEPKMAASEETYVPVGSHIRTRRGKPKAAPSTTLSAEEFSQQAKTDQTYPNGEQIINARNGP